jgi:hypothetical protein
MSLMPCAAGVPFPACISLIAVAQFGGRLSGGKKTGNLAQTLDQLLNKNQQLLRKIRYLAAEIALVRNNLVNSPIRVREVHTLDYPSEKTQQFEKANQQTLGDDRVRNKPVRPGEVRTRVKAENTTAKIAAWFSDAIGSA